MRGERYGSETGVRSRVESEGLASHTRVMLYIIPLSFFCPPKIDVTLKITIGSKSKSDISKIQW
jgi:hypothetical protein